MPARRPAVDVGRHVRAARERRKLTQAALAEAVGIEDAALRAIESGRRGLSLEKLYALASALKLSPGSLLGEPEHLGPAGADAARIVAALDQRWQEFALRVLRDLEKSSAQPQRRRRRS